MTAKRVAVLAAAVALAFWGFLRFFPNQASCVASGRTVDPTKRHCVGPNGYVQLREHVLFHTQEPVVFLVLLGTAIYFVRRRRRNRARIQPEGQ